VASDGSFSAFAWHRAVLSEICTLDPSEGLVMLALVRYADARGSAFPGFAALVRATRVRRSKLIESLAELEARGLFVRRVQTCGRGLGSNRYQLPLEPPTEGLGGDRRVAHHANQSATRTSPRDELVHVVDGGSPPDELGVVHVVDGGSPPRGPYLLRDLPIDLPTDLERSFRSPAKGRRATRNKTSEKEARAPWRRVPDSWQPDESHRALASHLKVDCASRAALFKDHEFQRPRSDASAAFRNWLRRAAEFGAARHGTSPEDDREHRVKVKAAEERERAWQEARKRTIEELNAEARAQSDGAVPVLDLETIRGIG